MPKGQKRKQKDTDIIDLSGDDLDTGAKPKSAVKRRQKSSKGQAEKRVNAQGGTVRYSAAASQKTRERIARALPGSGHRMFLLSRKVAAPIGSEGGPVELFDVLGATGNVYQVCVGRFPKCSCPDFAKGNICKHYLYVMIRVLRLREQDPVVWQKALLLSEAEEVFNGSRSTRTEEQVLATSALVQEWKRMQGDEGAEEQAAQPCDSSKPIEGDCPICYDEMHPGGSTAETKVVACGICKNYIHESCFGEWRQQKKASKQEVTCVYCRNPWPDSGGAAGTDGEYMNLKDLSAEHRSADTSLQALYGDNARWIGFHRRSS